MADINSITNAAGYTGNAALGGGLGIGAVIDVTPMQRLANFTYYRDRDLWEQKQKQDAEAAKQIANIAAYDISSPLTPYSETLKTQLSDIQKYIRENPDALVYSRNPQKFTELNEKINKFSTLRQTATASDAVYNARKNAIDKEVDPRKREVLRKELDLDVSEFLAGGVDKTVGQTLKTSPELKPEDSQLPMAKITEYTVIDEAPNKDIKNKFKFVNLDQLRADSELLAAGAASGQIDENAPWFRALSPERKQIEREKRSITSEQRQKIKKLSSDFNSLLAAYKANNPTLDLAKIEGEATGDTLLDNIKWANAINGQIDQLNELIAGGTLKDPTGRVINKKYEHLNLNDGLSEAEIIMMNAIQSSKSPLWSLDKEITQTDNALQTQREKNNAANDRVARNISSFNAETDRYRLGWTKDANGKWVKPAAGSGAGEIRTSGNAFDEIGATEQVDIVEVKGKTSNPTGDYILDGIVYGKDKKPKTGKIKVDPTALPGNLVAALKTAGTDLAGASEIEVVVKDGQINSIRADGGNPISRQAMENAQKKFDTEGKGADPLNWGRNINVKPLERKVNVPGL